MLHVIFFLVRRDPSRIKRSNTCFPCTTLFRSIWRNYPIGSKVELVERLLERGVLHDEKRAITKNRQPGRCCDTGCTTPGQPMMVALPASRKPIDGPA